MRLWKYWLFSTAGVIVNDLCSSLSPQAVNTLQTKIKTSRYIMQCLTLLGSYNIILCDKCLHALLVYLSVPKNCLCILCGHPRPHKTPGQHPPGQLVCASAHYMRCVAYLYHDYVPGAGRPSAH